MKPDAEINAIQERVNRHLPRVVGEAPDRPVKVFVRRGSKAGTALVQFSYTDRGDDKDYEPGRTLIREVEVSLLTKWTNLAFADFLAKAVTQLLRPEE